MPDVMEILAAALRGVIVPGPGKQFYVADYAGIEARVLLWLAEDEAGLDIFRKGLDIYCEMATAICGYPVIANPEHPPEERKLGKVAILGLGYQMGWAKFVDTAFDLGGVVISEEESKKTVNAYREKFWRVKRTWDNQQEAAINATQHPERPYSSGLVEWQREGRFLFCTLPSGRRLAYADPQITMKSMPWDVRDKRASLSFMGVHPLSKKWLRQWTYGGSLVENQTQAVARDFMSAAMLRCEKSGIYQPVLSVHDEIVSEADLGTGSAREYEALLTRLPDWGEGCPIAVESWVGTRYKK